MGKQPYYITTAIVYTSRKPHIGNNYEIVLTDAIARHRRMQGYDVFFLTGTDEHGQKVEQNAREAGLSPQAYVDELADGIKELYRMLNISYDKFIRTTDPAHKSAVKKIFRKLYDQNDIYKGEYEGMYCTPCESFWTESQLVDGKCPDCGREVRPAKEEAYFLRLSKYQKKLEKLLEEQEGFLLPDSRVKEMLNNFIKPGLQDLCVSRTSFKWGIPVDFDEGHVIYVWIDALSNYITALGYDPDSPSDDYKKYWPADLQIVGKDIVRFHSIYWPTMLMALGESLPKRIFGHPWLLTGNDKMSKSKGNVIYTDDLVKLLGVDAVRYYLISQMPYSSDGSITYESVFETYNTDLANTLGNLVNRTLSMSGKYFDGDVLPPYNTDALDEELSGLALATVKTVRTCMDECRFSDALEAIMALARRSNKYIDETMPWALAKDERQKERLGSVLYHLLESIRFLGVMLAPFLPDTSASILTQINTSLDTYESLETFGGLEIGGRVGQPKPLFARLDTEKLLADIANQQKESQQKKSESAPAQKPVVEGLAQIAIDDFMKVELRAAKILECETVKKSKKLLKLMLDDGTDTPRQVVSGIAPWYQPEDLTGKTVVVVANLKPAKLCGVESNGMILAADCSETDVQVLFLDGVPAGARIR